MRTIFLTAIALVSFLTISQAQLQNVAVISLSSDQNVNTDELGENSVGMILEMANKDAFDMELNLEKFRAYFYDTLRSEFPFPIIDHEKIVGNEAFQKIREESYDESLMSKIDGRIASPGYAKYPSLSKKQVPAYFEAFKVDGVDALMVLTLDYGLTGKVLIGGNGTAVGYADLKVGIYNADGKRIFSMGSRGKGTTTIAVALSIVTGDSKQIPGMLQEATDALAEDIKSDLPKRIKKMEKKLAKLSAKGK